MRVTRAFISWAVVFVFIGFAASVAATGGESSGKSSAAARGRSVYTANCARCHGADGRSQTSMGEMTQAPDLTDSAWQRRRSAAHMIASVTNGRGEMPAFKNKLSRQEIAAAVGYVRTLKR